MKKVALLFAAAFITAALLSYTLRTPDTQPLSVACNISCFNTETRDLIQADAAQAGFAAFHENPKYFKYQNAVGETISFSSPDGKNAQGYFIKSKKKSKKWLLVIQEFWGLNDYIKKESDVFYSELGDVNVLALDMYDGKVSANRDSAAMLMRSSKPERLENIIKAAIEYAGSNAKIYTVGWCFGGGWSLQATILAGKQANGCVMYYGRPETNMEKLKSINCDVIGFFGNKDQGIKPEMVNTFEKNMKEAGKNISVYRYDAGHGFANPSNPIYNKEATEDAHAKAIAFLKAH
ncbi:MAG: dienelactone hydrolase family protein [Bacteroidetes bacterium]|nr:dienelactone hydrolase family protein [Bacteroidota bacterium]